MTMNSIAQNGRLVQSLSEQELKVWQVALAYPVGEDGIIPTEALAEAWPGGTNALAWETLLYATVCRLNSKLRPFGLRLKGIQGGRKPGSRGYRIVEIEATPRSPRAQAMLMLGDALMFGLHHIDKGTDQEPFAREWLFDMCSWMQFLLLDPEFQTEGAE